MWHLLRSSVLNTESMISAKSYRLLITTVEPALRLLGSSQRRDSAPQWQTRLCQQLLSVILKRAAHVTCHDCAV